MSLKFTTVLIPPILALLWVIDLWLNPARLAEGDRQSGRFRRLVGIARRVGVGMVAFLAVMAVSNLVVTGFAMIPLSSRSGSHPLLMGGRVSTLKPLANRLLETPFPNDWVGFATQMTYQRDGGPSYLMGERRMTGWTHYYLVTLAVKVPLAFWLLVIGRAMMKRRSPREAREWVLPVFIATFLLLAMFGSKRNYGFRYLLPIATPAIVWTSGRRMGNRCSETWVAALGLVGMGYAVGSIHPHELSYFNEVAGGPIGGRKILSDSNLDWGQGARSLARLQRSRPEFRDLTLFYFGDTDPSHYGVEGRRIIFDANHEPAGLPSKLTVETKFLAVSVSSMGSVGARRLFPDLERRRADRLHGRPDHRDLPDLGRPPADQNRSRPRVSRSSRLSAVRAIRWTRPAESIGMASWTGMFWMTTKYSSPRRILMAKCPSTIRALSWSKIRGSRSLAVPQIETSETIDRPAGSTPA